MTYPNPYYPPPRPDPPPPGYPYDAASPPLPGYLPPQPPPPLERDDEPFGWSAAKLLLSLCGISTVGLRGKLEVQVFLGAVLILLVFLGGLVAYSYIRYG